MKLLGERFNKASNKGRFLSLCSMAPLLFALLFLLSCAERLQVQEEKAKKLEVYIKSKYQKPTDVDEHLHRIASMYEIRKPDYRWPEVIPGRKYEPEPLPGRLIVQIAPTEIAATFKPEAAKYNLRLLTEKNLLPRNLEITHFSYLGFS